MKKYNFIVNLFYLHNKKIMKNQKIKAFTLVELIVVITIIAILWTIAFISLQWYSSQARDTTRITDIQNIKTSLELFSLNTWKYPLPDNKQEVSYSWEILWNQWIVWDKVTTNLSRNLNEKPLDPLTEIEYTYSTINSQTKYELLSSYESDLISYNNLLNSINAANANYPKISWNYNWVFVKTTSYYIPTPSIINAELDWVWWTLDDNNITSQIITGWENNIANWQEEIKIDWLTWLTIQAFSWTISTENNDNKELLAQVLIDAYSWTILANNWIYKQIVETTWINDLISLIDVIVLKNIWTSSTEGWWDTIISWTTLDPNCDIEDIHIPSWCNEWDEWCQIWAWCNSTLWEWIEYDVDEGCSDYTWASTTWCNRPSNEKENVYNPTYGIDNIWWKLYTWNSMDTDNDEDIDVDDTNLVCWIWYHVPTSVEWTILEDYLKSNKWDSNIWWSIHTTQDETNNLIEALKIPVAWVREGSTFKLRAAYSFLWSSNSSGPSYSIVRFFNVYNSAIYTSWKYQTNWYSVRCIKD